MASIRNVPMLRVTTRCQTVDEFVAKFARLVDERSILLLTGDRLPVGQREPFAIELADGTPVLRGEAEVAESSPPPDGGLRLQFIALDDSARAVHQRMLQQQPVETEPRGTTRMFGLLPPPSRAPVFQIASWSPPPPIAEPEDETATIRMPALFADEPPAMMIARTTRHRPLRPAAAHPGWLIVAVVAAVLLGTIALLLAGGRGLPDAGPPVPGHAAPP